MLNVSDNSGARVVKCIRIYNNKKVGSIGSYILVTVRMYNAKKKIKKGEIFLALIIRTKYSFKYKNSYYKFSDNACILMNKKYLPISSRVFGYSVRSLRLINKKAFLMVPYII
jgi:large subunit ribosomal protein L14